VVSFQARLEPQRGSGKHSRGAPKHFRGSLLKDFLKFFFSKWYILAYFIFLAKGGPPNVAGPEVAYPPFYPTLSTGLLPFSLPHMSARTLLNIIINNYFINIRSDNIHTDQLYLCIRTSAKVPRVALRFCVAVTDVRCAVAYVTL